jgi:hypothetical protein
VKALGSSTASVEVRYYVLFGVLRRLVTDRSVSPTGIASSSTSRAPDVRQTMLFANRSTTARAKNCSIRTGSDRSRMHAHRPQPGVPITTSITRIVRWETSHRKSTPVERRTSLNASPFLERSWRKNGETSIYENSPLILGGMMGIRHGRSTRLACTSTLVNRTYFGSSGAGDFTPALSQNRT